MDKIIPSEYNSNVSSKTSSSQKNDNEVMFTIPNKDVKQVLANDTISFQDTQNMTLEELQSYYGNKETQAGIRNKFLASQFSSDINLSLSIFNQISSMTDEESINYLSSLFTHKSISFDSQTNSLEKGALLRKSIMSMIDDPDIKAEQEKIEKEFLSTMIQFDIMSYFNSILDFGKSEKDKNKDSEYSFLYNNFYDQYDILLNDYTSNKELNDMLIKQY